MDSDKGSLSPKRVVKLDQSHSTVNDTGSGSGSLSNFASPNFTLHEDPTSQRRPSKGYDFVMPDINLSAPSLSANMSSSLKFQELPEFRVQNSHIETSIKEEVIRRPSRFSTEYYTKLKIAETPVHTDDPFLQEYGLSAKSILGLLKLRDKYMFSHCQYTLIKDLIEPRKNSQEPTINYLKENRRLPKMENVCYKVENGVYIPYLDGRKICHFADMNQYSHDMSQLISGSHNSSNKSFCFKRLNILEEKFKIHLLYNRDKEILEQKSRQQRDFYNVRKVDTHIHHSACMNVNMLLRFIKKKAQKEPNKPVIFDPQTKKTLTLREVFEKHQLETQNINVDVLDVQAGFETFHRFDRFNKKYNPFSRTDFREIFLKVNNFIEGEYLAEITKDVFDNYAQCKYIFSELRISIYGRNAKEWDQLATWFDKFGLYHHQVRWLIQIPRLYEVYRKADMIQNFQQMIDNIFQPLFEVTINPDSSPALYKFLLQVVGFDSVDDESVYEKSATSTSFSTPPEEWTQYENPHYCYWAYYIWANIYNLNYLRKIRGLNSFAFRPHAGEAGSSEHLMAAYLLADGINHGIKLEKAPVLQYLYYLKQIGIAMSPLSNNKLFVKYKSNPLPKFLARGLNVSLSTDDPLIFHMTTEPLIEEYSIAMQVYDFSSCDMCEIARNSVVQSGFEEICKKYWIGENFKSQEADDTCFEKTNVPHTRYLYRMDTLKSEIRDLENIQKYG